VRVSVSSAPASASQADFLRDLWISQAAISPTTSPINRIQPSAPKPSDSAEAGAPAADGVEVDVGVSAAADVSGDVLGGAVCDVRVEVDSGGSAVVGVRVDSGGSAVVGVRVDSVSAVVVLVGRVVGAAAVLRPSLVVGRSREGSVEGRAVGTSPLPVPQPPSQRTRPIISPASKPALLVGAIRPEVVPDVRMTYHLRTNEGRPCARHQTPVILRPRLRHRIIRSG
jgi:hypothetical protein